jgi:hypothetical protein
MAHKRLVMKDSPQDSDHTSKVLQPELFRCYEPESRHRGMTTHKRLLAYEEYEKTTVGKSMPRLAFSLQSAWLVSADKHL